MPPKAMGPAPDEVGFAIVRVDTYPTAEGMRVSVTVTKVIWDEVAADAEVQRLNAAKTSHCTTYLMRSARIQSRRSE